MEKYHEEFNICQLLSSFIDNRSVEAMTLFYKKISLPCFRMALKYTYNEANAEDIVQTAFIKILKNCHQYQPSEDRNETHLLAWCFAIVINEAKMNHRSEKSRNKREAKIAGEKMQSDQCNTINDEEHNPKLMALVTTELNLLPEKYKIPLSMKYIEGLKDSEIAIALKQNQNTTRSLIKRGLERLNQKVNRSMVVPTILLFALIKNQSLQAAPQSLNIFIDHKLKSKIISAKPSNDSSKLTLSKQSVTINKAIFFTITFSITALGSLFLFKSPIIANKIESKLSNTTQEINRIWNYENEDEREFKVITGDFKWNENKKILATNFDKPFWLELPLTMDAYPLQIDLKVKAHLGEKTTGKLSLTPFLSLNGEVLPAETVGFSAVYSITNEDFTIMSTYITDNSIYSFYGKKCIHIARYKDNLKKGNIGFLFKNYGINQVSAKTIRKLPQFVIEEIAKADAREWNKIEATSTESISIIFND